LPVHEAKGPDQKIAGSILEVVPRKYKSRKLERKCILAL